MNGVGLVWCFTRMICVSNMFCTFFLDEKGTQKIKTYLFHLHMYERLSFHASQAQANVCCSLGLLEVCLHKPTARQSFYICCVKQIGRLVAFCFREICFHLRNLREGKRLMA
jgi:hypothetical protein